MSSRGRFVSPVVSDSPRLSVFLVGIGEAGTCLHVGKSPLSFSVSLDSDTHLLSSNISWFPCPSQRLCDDLSGFFAYGLGTL